MTRLMFIITPAYFAAIILAHKYGGYHVDGKWLVPLMALFAIYFWRNREHRHPRSH